MLLGSELKIFLVFILITAPIAGCNTLADKTLAPTQGRHV